MKSPMIEETRDQGSPATWKQGLPSDDEELLDGFYWIEYEQGGRIGLFHVVWPVTRDFAGATANIHEMGVTRWAGPVLLPQETSCSEGTCMTRLKP